jgi:hypothetical protein
MLPWPGRQKAMIRLMVSTSFPVPFEACWRGDSTGKEANHCSVGLSQEQFLD